MADDAETEPRFTAEQVEDGRVLFAGPCDFVKGVVGLDGLPPGDMSEVAFAGRSNVGKSSLLNALTGRKTLARTSNTPGRTREINFFSLGGRLYLVDMPGYGYARAERRQVEAWNRLVRAYLRGRASLRRVFVLIDARHGIKANDTEILEMLDEAAVSFQVVLTKADKLKLDALDAVEAAVSRVLLKHPAAHPVVHVTSSEKRTGIDTLRAEIAALTETRSGS